MRRDKHRPVEHTGTITIFLNFEQMMDAIHKSEKTRRINAGINAELKEEREALKKANRRKK